MVQSPLSRISFALSVSSSINTWVFLKAVCSIMFNLMIFANIKGFNVICQVLLPTLTFVLHYPSIFFSYVVFVVFTTLHLCDSMTFVRITNRPHHDIQFKFLFTTSKRLIY